MAPVSTTRSSPSTPPIDSSSSSATRVDSAALAQLKVLEQFLTTNPAVTSSFSLPKLTEETATTIHEIFETHFPNIKEKKLTEELLTQEVTPHLGVMVLKKLLLKKLPKNNSLKQKNTPQEILDWLSKDKNGLRFAETVKILDLRNQNLDTLPQALKLFPNLEDLQLQDNPIKKLSKDIFDSLTQLKCLSIHNIDLQEAPDHKVFEKLENLIRLNFSFKDNQRLQSAFKVFDTRKLRPVLVKF